jgi:acyl-CoA hydrolase
MLSTVYDQTTLNTPALTGVSGRESPMNSTLEKALSSLPRKPRVFASGNHATPWETLAYLDQRIEEYSFFTLNGQRGIPDREGVVLETTFVGSGMRHSPRLRYFPARLSMTPLLFHEALPLDVALIHTTTPRNGRVSLGTEVNIVPAAIEAVRARGGLVIAEANKQMPYTFGDGEIEVSDIDLIIEVDRPLDSPHRSSLTPASMEIGARVAGLVSDGSTMQMGIGAVPDAVLHSLAGHQGLRIWTEMFSDGVMALDRAGALDPAAPLTTSFVFGSKDFYSWVDGNERITMLRTEKTNDPALILQNPKMTSVNTALQVDLFGQANASYIGTKIYSGFGGQTDFLVGALHSRSGMALMALASWHPKALVSTIVPQLSSPVTSFQQSAVITEQGVAVLAGRNASDQANALIEKAAHPDARGELRSAMAELGLR